MLSQPLMHVCLAGNEEGLVRLLLGVATRRPGHGLAHPLHRCPRQHWLEARHHPEGELIRIVPVISSLNPDQLQADSHVLQLAGHSEGAGTMPIRSQACLPGLFLLPFVCLCVM